jgi:hypothetical protein
MPTKFRGQSIIVLNLFLTVGSIIGWFICFMINESFTEGDFKKVYLFAAISPFLSSSLVYLFFIESPRLLLASKKYDKAF